MEVTRFATLLLLPGFGVAQTSWPSYGNDLGAMRYSTLRQINSANAGRLKLAWTFRAGKPGSEAIPIVIDGVMYVTAPDGVYALVPETGELLESTYVGGAGDDSAAAVAVDAAGGIVMAGHSAAAGLAAPEHRLAHAAPSGAPGAFLARVEETCCGPVSADW